jgi:hypothetical protein
MALLEKAVQWAIAVCRKNDEGKGALRNVISDILIEMSITIQFIGEQPD